MRTGTSRWRWPLPETRQLASGRTPWEVLAGEVGRLRRDLTDLRSTVLARIPAASPRLKVRNTAGSLVNANTNVPYLTVIEDTHDGWVAGSLHYVVPRSGVYLITFQFKWAAAPAALPLHHIRVNNAAVTFPPSEPLAAFGGGNYSYQHRLTAGEEVEVFCAGTGYTMQNDGVVDNNFLAITFLRP